MASKLFENNFNGCLTPYCIDVAKFNCVLGCFDFYTIINEWKTENKFMHKSLYESLIISLG